MRSDSVGIKVSPVLRSRLLLFFFGREDMLREKKWLVQISFLRPAYYICTRARYTRTWMHTCRNFAHLDSSGSKCVLPRPFGSHLSTPDAVCVCVCAYTPKIAKIQTNAPSFLPSKTTLCQPQVPCID